MAEINTQESIIESTALIEEGTQELTRELSSLLEHNAGEVRSQWIKEMRGQGLLAALPPKEIEEQSKAIYEACLLCLKTGSYEAAQRYAAGMATKAVLPTMTVDQIIAGLLILRDVYHRYIFEWYHKNPKKWQAFVSVYEPVARKILNIVALAFVAERESIIRQQQQEVAKLSTPVVDVWEGVVMLPLIGILDSARAKKITESILERVGKEKTELIIILSIGGISAIDTKTANHILRTVHAVKLMGSEMIITGIRPDVATTLVTLGIDLSGIVTRSTMREGLEYAFDKLKLKVTKTS
jgi:rsbT co-antagonist protein RsbR